MTVGGRELTKRLWVPAGAWVPVPGYGKLRDIVDTMQLLGERYRLSHRLGTGGMSVVWRGYDELLGRQVAVKVPTPECNGDPAYRDRIRHEATTPGRPSHPNIAVVYDYGEVPDGDNPPVPYMVMELIEGQSLADRLADGPLPWQVAVGVAGQVAAALTAVHAAGLVHRDVTPANVLLSPSGAKLIDFGISAPAGERERRGLLLGTPAYLAPERLAGVPVHPAADIYALGVLLYQALAGKFPWDGQTAPEILAQHRHAPPNPLPEIPDLPPEVAELCMACLRKPPSQRPSAPDLAMGLARALADRLTAAGAPAPPRPTIVVPPPAPPAPPPPPTMAMPRQVRRGWYLVPAGVLVLALFLVWLGTGRWGGAVAAPPGVPAPASAGASIGAAACEVRVVVRTRWDTGFTADLVLTNTGTAAVSTWTLTFALPGGQRVVAGWNGAFSQSGDRVSVRDAGYNAMLNPGRSTTLGFNGAAQRGTAGPSAFVLNGTPCGG